MLRKEKGQSLVEFALILPVVLFLFMGMVEVGWAMHSYVTVATAAREASRFGSRASFDEEEVAEAAVVALGALDVQLEGSGANTAVIVTFVDIDPEGGYTINPSYVTGDLPVSSLLTEGFVAQLAADNVVFNGDPAHCPVESPPPCEVDSANDLVVVEAFYMHSQLLGLPLVSDLLSNPVSIYSRGIMRLANTRYD